MDSDNAMLLLNASATMVLNRPAICSKQILKYKIIYHTNTSCKII